VDVVATGPHLVERGRLDAVLLARPPRDRVQPDVRDLRAVEHPDVVAAVGVHDARCHVGVLRRDASIEQVGRFDDVVVDADEDHVVGRRAHNLRSLP
jgi:hypothetical protein